MTYYFFISVKLNEYFTQNGHQIVIVNSIKIQQMAILLNNMCDNK